MKSQKHIIAIVTGGTSAEIEIALKGAEVVRRNLPLEFYELHTIYIYENEWYTEVNGKKILVDKNDFSISYESEKITFDCAFVIIHGKPAENGKLQAYFDLIGLPYTCSGVFASSISYNKEACKSFLQDLHLDMANSVIIKKGSDLNVSSFNLKFPVFVKPNQEGSSYGISKVNQEEELISAIEKAHEFDDQVMIEEAIEGREITCGLTYFNGDLTPLPLTEIVSKKEFFDFEAKYEGASEEITPARISEEEKMNCQQISKTIYNKLGCKGLVRIDYILNDEGLYLLEVNSIPGLSEESIVPQQAAEYGIPLSELFHIQIQQALPSSYQHITS